MTALDSMLAPTAPNSMLQLLHPNEHITGWTANRCCCIMYATVSAYAAASAMRRPVRRDRGACSP